MAVASSLTYLLTCLTRYSTLLDPAGQTAGLEFPDSFLRAFDWTGLAWLDGIGIGLNRVGSDVNWLDGARQLAKRTYDNGGITPFILVYGRTGLCHTNRALDARRWILNTGQDDDKTTTRPQQGHD